MITLPYGFKFNPTHILTKSKVLQLRSQPEELQQRPSIRDAIFARSMEEAPIEVHQSTIDLQEGS